MKKNGTSGPEIIEEIVAPTMVDPLVLAKSLADVEYLMECCLCPFFILEQTARDIVDDRPLSGSRVSIGILQRYLTKEVMSTLETKLKEKLIKEPYGYSYQDGEIKVKIIIIKGKFDFFKNPDFRYFMATQYNIPNPFEGYWKAKEFVI